MTINHASMLLHPNSSINTCMVVAMAYDMPSWHLDRIWKKLRQTHHQFLMGSLMGICMMNGLRCIDNKSHLFGLGGNAFHAQENKMKACGNTRA